MKNNKRIYLLALLPFIVIVGLFELAPLVSILISSISRVDGTGVTFAHFYRIFTTDLYLNSIKGSIQISIISSLIGIAIASFGAKALKESTGFIGKAFRNILNITSNFAGIPLAFAFMILLGNVGILTLFAKSIGFDAIAKFDLYSINGLMLTYIYFQIPLATLLLLPSFNILKKQWLESVKLLGGNNFIYWLKVGIPNLMPSILGTFSVLFSNAIAAYATGYALLSSNAMLLSVRISEQFVGDLVQAKEFGSALAVVLMLLMVLTVQMTGKLQKMNKGVKES